MAREQQPSRINPNKVVGVIALLLVAAGVCFWGVNYTIEHTPLPVPTDSREALTNLNSTRFKNMPEARRVDYIMQTALLLEAIPIEQRRELFVEMNVSQENRNQIWVSREFNNALRFAQAITQEEKNKFLDEQIDRMQARIRERQAAIGRGGEGGGGGAGGPNGADPNAGPQNGPPDQGGANSVADMRAQARARIAASFETGNPQRAQLNSEYRRAMAERMQERGITPSGSRQ